MLLCALMCLSSVNIYAYFVICFCIECFYMHAYNVLSNKLTLIIAKMFQLRLGLLMIFMVAQAINVTGTPSV